MTTVNVEPNLPEQIARQAEQAGLLTGPAIERLIEEAVRREAGAKLIEAMKLLRDADAPALTEDDSVAVVTDVRATYRASDESCR